MASMPDSAPAGAPLAGRDAPAPGRPSRRGHAVCAACSRAFPAVLTDGRCPQCQTLAPRGEWGEEILGPIAAAWYGALKDPRKVIGIVLALATVAMVELGVLVVKY